MTADRHDLKRFLDAQGGTYAQATGELRRDRHRPGRPDDRGNLRPARFPQIPLIDDGEIFRIDDGSKHPRSPVRKRSCFPHHRGALRMWWRVPPPIVDTVGL
jgi:hypothetical protein